MSMNTIHRRDWNLLPSDYKQIVDGQAYVLRMTEHGTAMVRVIIVGDDDRKGRTR